MTDDQQQQLPLGDPAPDATAAKLAAMEKKLTQAGQSAASMEQRLAAMQAQLASGRQPDAANGDQVNNQLWQILQNDPKQLLAAQQAVMQRHLAAYDQQNRASRFASDKVLARNAVREESPDYEEVFKKYGSDVEGYIAKVWPNAPEAFTNADVWRTAADAVRGQKWKELSASSRETDPGAPGKPSPKPMPSNKGKDNDEPLNDQEIHAAEQIFGTGQENYKKWKKFNKEQRDESTVKGRSMLQSPLAKMWWKDNARQRDGLPNPHYGKMRPVWTFDSEVQKPHYPREEKA